MAEETIDSAQAELAELEREPEVPEWVTDKSTAWCLTGDGDVWSIPNPSDKTKYWLMGNLFKSQAEAIAARDKQLAQVRAERMGEVREWQLVKYKDDITRAYPIVNGVTNCTSFF